MQHLFSCTPSSKLPLIKQHSFHLQALIAYLSKQILLV